MALGQDPYLEFSKNLVDRYIQFKGIQVQQELLRRREQRYDLQLQDNRLHRQRQLSNEATRIDQSERRLGGYLAGKSQTNITLPVFSPGQMTGTSQTQGIQDIIAEELSSVDDISDANQIDLAKQNALTRTGVKYQGAGKTDQFDFEFDSQLKDKLNPPPDEPGIFSKIGGAVLKSVPWQYQLGKKVFQGPQTEAEDRDAFQPSEPKTKDEFNNTLRRLQTEDYDKAKTYYEAYLDRFY